MKSCNIFFHVLISLFIVVCSACSSDDDFDSRAKYLPAKIISEGEISSTVTTYSYDDNNRLTGVVKTDTYQEDNIRNEISLAIIYDDFGKISSVIKKTEAGDLLFGMSTEIRDTVNFYYDGTSIHTKNSITEINNKNRVVAHRVFDESGSNEISSIKYKYDFAGNLSEFLFSDGEVVYSYLYTYEYDDNNGIFKDVNIPQWFLITQLDEKLNFAGNSVQETFIATDKDPVTTTRTYTYNSDGYPVSESVYYAGYSLTVNVKPIKIEYISGK